MYGPVRTVVWADGGGDPASDPVPGYQQSAVPKYDWIGAEPGFKVSAARLSDILPQIHE